MFCWEKVVLEVPPKSKPKLEAIPVIAPKGFGPFGSSTTKVSSALYLVVERKAAKIPKTKNRKENP